MICFDPKGIENKNIVKYSYPSGIKNCEIHIIDTCMVFKRDDAGLDLVYCGHFEH